ncbi:MAG: gfo/Idh/MocA family oxidoreductase, partial [Phycisphaerales bacterium]
MKASQCTVPSKSTSRRGFLKLSGQMVASSAFAAGIVPRMYAAEGGAIKLALVGCGGRGTGAVADAFATTGGPVKLYAVADLFEDRVQTSLKNLREAHADKVDVPPERQFVGFDAYKKAIDCLNPGDVALLTTHAAFRPMHFEYAVSRGVNVFAEKSFATDAPA